jgi:hypothetical protein
MEDKTCLSLNVEPYALVWFLEIPEVTPASHTLSSLLEQWVRLLLATSRPDEGRP